MITDEQFERLPALFREIVEVDRELDAILDAEFIDLKALRNLRARRSDLRHAAARKYGKARSDDNLNRTE